MDQKKIIAIGVTDTHLKPSNIELVTDIFKQISDFMWDNNVKKLYHFGDWFTSRPGQTLEVLIATRNILEQFKHQGVIIDIIPGNHDKKDLDSTDSYLNVFNSSHCRVHTEYYYEEYMGVVFSMIPYYRENTLYPQHLSSLVSELEKFKPELPHYLLTHIAVNGVKNNDGSLVENRLTPKSFSHFRYVHVGHYHDASYIGPNIYYVGSAYQANYGEDEDKGFIVYYSDGTWDKVKLKFPVYKKIEVDVQGMNPNTIQALKQLKEEGLNLRVVVKGPREKLEAFNREELVMCGIDCRQESSEVSAEMVEASQEQVNTFTVGKIHEVFQEYLDLKEVPKENQQYGFNLLKQIGHVDTTVH